jgi:rubrerythrin
MDFQNLQEIIQFAIEKEIEAAEFYESVSREESMSGSREMLQEFALEEKKHRKMLEAFVAGGVTEGLEDYEFKWIKDIKRSDYTVDLTYEKGMGYNDLLLMAAQREEKALKLYNELLAQAGSKEAKQLFKVLCQEEAKHKLYLETKYDDYMADMGD